MNFHLSNILALKIVVEISCLLCESIKVTALEGEGSQLPKQFLLSRRVPSSKHLTFPVVNKTFLLFVIHKYLSKKV